MRRPAKRLTAETQRPGGARGGILRRFAPTRGTGAGPGPSGSGPAGQDHPDRGLTGTPPHSARDLRASAVSVGRTRRARRPGSRSGQGSLEFALLYGGVVLPLTFMVVFVAEMLWVWHSVADFTRDGARYAATHCWQADTSNVLTYMQSHVPFMVDMDQFIDGSAGILVSYYTKDPTSGDLSDFTCDGAECTVDCTPDAVSVSITNYQFTRFSGFFKLPPVIIPDFRTTAPIGSGGCDEGGNCLP